MDGLTKKLAIDAIKQVINHFDFNELGRFFFKDLKPVDEYHSVIIGTIKQNKQEILVVKVTIANQCMVDGITQYMLDAYKDQKNLIKNELIKYKLTHNYSAIPDIITKYGLTMTGNTVSDYMDKNIYSTVH